MFVAIENDYPDIAEETQMEYCEKCVGACLESHTALVRLRQEDDEFEARLCLAISCMQDHSRL